MSKIETEKVLLDEQKNLIKPTVNNECIKKNDINVENSDSAKEKINEITQADDTQIEKPYYAAYGRTIKIEAEPVDFEEEERKKERKKRDEDNKRIEGERKYYKELNAKRAASYPKPKKEKTFWFVQFVLFIGVLIYMTPT